MNVFTVFLNDIRWVVLQFLGWLVQQVKEFFTWLEKRV
jgi:hypothetical protein